MGKRTQTCIIPQTSIPGPTDQEGTWTLSAIIRHTEYEQRMSHSTTLAKRADKWYEFDDDKVREISEKDIIENFRVHLGGNEQIFIYTNKNSQEHTWRVLPPEKESDQGEHVHTEPQTEPWPVPALTREVIQHRTTKGFPTGIGQEDIAAPTTETICEEYTQEVHSAMNNDTQKIKAYMEAIKEAVKNDKTMNIDLGCGANATLTKEILRVHGQCIAIELNPKAAITARRTIADLANKSEWK